MSINLYDMRFMGDVYGHFPNQPDWLRYNTSVATLKPIDEDEIDKIIESEEINMKLTGFKKVAVITQGYGGTYYYALYDDTIEAGDKVLVSGAAEGKLHTVDEVISVEETANRYGKDITAEVICKVDLSAYDKRVADRKEAKKIKDEMDRAIKKMDELNKYEMYAKNNPELDEMLSKYKELVG